MSVYKYLLGMVLFASPAMGRTCQEVIKLHVPKADVRELIVTEHFFQFQLEKTSYGISNPSGYVFFGERAEYKLTDEFKAKAVYIGKCTGGELEYDIWVSKDLFRGI